MNMSIIGDECLKNAASSPCCDRSLDILPRLEFLVAQPVIYAYGYELELTGPLGGLQ